MHPFASPLFLLLALLLSATSFVRAEEDYETMGVLPQSFFEPESSLAKRAADLTQLDPRDTEAFYWSTNRNNGSSTVHVASMTMFTRDGERILSVERFRPMLKSLQCGPKMVLAFNSRENFEYAIRAWDWVNEDETRTFIMVADDPGCGPDDVRVPYLIYNADYDEENYTAYLYGAEKEWEEVAQSFDFEIGELSMPDPNAPLDKRGLTPHPTFTKSVDLGVGKNMNGNWFNVDTKYGGLRMDCIDCGTKGKFRASLRVETRWGSPSNIIFSVKPVGVRADLGLRMVTNLRKPPRAVSLSYSKTIVEVPCPYFPKIKIPFVGSLDCKLKWKGGISTEGHELFDATVDWGAEAGFHDSAIASVGFNKGDNKFSGWGPWARLKPLKIKGNGRADVDFFIQATAGPRFELFKKEWEVGFVARLPQLVNRIDTVNDKKGAACADKGMDGISLNQYLGISFGFRAGLSGDIAVTVDVLPKAMFGNMKRNLLEAGDDAPQIPVVTRRIWSRPSASGRNNSAPAAGPPGVTKWNKRGLGPGARLLIQILDFAHPVASKCFNGKKKPKPPANTKPKPPKPSTKPSKPPKETPDPPKKPPPKKGPRTCKVTENNVRYRTCANTSKKCTPLGQVHTGDKVSLVCRTTGESVEGNTAWARTDKKAYLSLQFVDKACGNMLPPC